MNIFTSSLRSALLIGASAFSFVTMLPTSAQAAIFASSTFDNDTDGWLVDDFVNASPITSTPNYISTGGNPGGYIQDTDRRSTGGWFFKAPSKFQGNISAAYNGILSFDSNMPVKGIENNADGDIVLEGGGDRLFFNTPNNPGTDWTSYSISLNEAAGWTLQSTGLSPTQTEMLAVLSSLTNFWIRGEYSNGIETVGLDNVVLSIEEPESVPEPSSALGVLALGALVATSNLKRKKVVVS